MEMGWTRGAIAVVTLLVFLGICWWAFRPKNKRRFEKDAMLPFADEKDGPQVPGKGGESDSNEGASR